MSVKYKPKSKFTREAFSQSVELVHIVVINSCTFLSSEKVETLLLYKNSVDKIMMLMSEST